LTGEMIIISPFFLYVYLIINPPYPEIQHCLFREISGLTK